MYLARVCRLTARRFCLLSPVLHKTAAVHAKLVVEKSVPVGGSGNSSSIAAVDGSGGGSGGGNDAAQKGRHQLKASSLSAPTWCEFCERFIFAAKASRCEKCNLSVHRACADKFVNVFSCCEAANDEVSWNPFKVRV